MDSLPEMAHIKKGGSDQLVSERGDIQRVARRGNVQLVPPTHRMIDNGSTLF